MLVLRDGIKRADLDRKDVEDSEQARQIDGRRLARDLGRSAALRHAAIANDDHVIGQLEALVEAVRDKDNGRAVLGADLTQDVVQLEREGAHRDRGQARRAGARAGLATRARAMEAALLLASGHFDVAFDPRLQSIGSVREFR